MSYFESIANSAQAVDLAPGSTSYFSGSSDTLDPRLFQGRQLREWVRAGVLDHLFDFLATHYDRPELWTHAWLAGSGVSYQWAAVRDPGDLDCLVGVEYSTFRRINPDYAGLSDLEISQTFNEGFSAELMPLTANWNGFELTFYVNPSTDIRDINPYAAYDLIHDSWVVDPDEAPVPPYTRAWESAAQRDYDRSAEIVNRYSNALDEVRRAGNTAHRINAESRLKLAVDHASELFDDIHAGRKIAFSQVGAGYSDFNNYRWQAGKKSGAVQALKRIRDYREEARKATEAETYGMELPDTNTLIRRAALGRTR